LIEFQNKEDCPETDSAQIISEANVVVFEGAIRENPSEQDYHPEQ
jgi:hypothetical protein